jgi:hypothetical protein
MPVHSGMKPGGGTKKGSTMKFLIINRTSPADPAAARKQAQQLRHLVSSGALEAAWMLREGGHAYVRDAGDSADPALAPVEGKEPGTDVEIFPITDAIALLEQAGRPGAAGGH